VSVENHGDPSRQQIGADLRATPCRPFTLLASTSYDLYEARWAETSVLGQVQIRPGIVAAVDYRHVEPDLFLARDSILAVFTVERQNEVGGNVHWEASKVVALQADYHFLEREGDSNGHRVEGRATWRPADHATVGVELGTLRSPDGNGYFRVRAFGSVQIERWLGTVDVQEYAFREAINGVDNSFLATASLRRPIGRGFSALLSGSGGVTPYFERRFDVLAKLSYELAYRKREALP
jgi:hypothetical protein